MIIYFQDPHEELKGKNVLIALLSRTEMAHKFDIDLDTMHALLREGRQKLLVARKKRPSPHLDTKMITAWNGRKALLMFFNFLSKF